MDPSQEHFSAFTDSVEGFIKRIQNRAVEKRKEMAAERGQEIELTKEERMGPGGLDPVDVFQSLPESLQEAFESQDTEKLQEALQNMDIEDAKYHMKRCEDSGLWVK